MDKKCCNAIPMIEKSTGRSVRICTYFSTKDKVEECIDIYCEECEGYVSRDEWRKKRENNNRLGGK